MNKNAQPCKTCGGRGTVDSDCYGGSTKHVIPCPACKPDARIVKRLLETLENLCPCDSKPDGCGDDPCRIFCDLKNALAHIERLEEALRKYGYHTNACPATTRHILEYVATGEKCECGYEQALKGE